MKKFIALVMVLGLVGFAAAQDLDAPTMGAAVDQVEDGGGLAAGVFDALVARIQQGHNDIMTNRTRNWRAAYWEIWAWEYGATSTERSFDMWGNFAGSDLSEAWGTYQEQVDALTSAEQAAVQQAAREAHRDIMAAGLN